jgi:hypothetical protein
VIRAGQGEVYQGGEEFREIVFNVLRGVLFELTQENRCIDISIENYIRICEICTD